MVVDLIAGWFTLLASSIVESTKEEQFDSDELECNIVGGREIILFFFGNSISTASTYFNSEVRRKCKQK